MDDLSNGWDAVARQLIDGRPRRRIGAEPLRRWAAQTLPRGSSVLDLACGGGIPVTEVLLSEGCVVSGVDPSSTLIAAYREQFPNCRVACEAAEQTIFFGETFDAIVAIGLMFLLPADTQRHVIIRVAAALKPGGHFLFTSPAGDYPPWTDSLTGRESVTLGKNGYVDALQQTGLKLVAEFDDEGQNHYFDAVLAP